MFTLPLDATDDQLRSAVSEWLRLVATGRVPEAEAFLDREDPTTSLGVLEFRAQVSSLSGGGSVTEPLPFLDDIPVEELIQHPTPLVNHWLPGIGATEKYPGFIADILHPIPVNGEWSDIDVSFFVRSKNGSLTLQLREIVKLKG